MSSKIALDLNAYKAAGVYTIEVDNTTRETETAQTLRMIVGFSNKGPFNRPVLLRNDDDRLAVFGDIDEKLEHKGCYFDRMCRTLAEEGPVMALNLLKVDERLDGDDQVGHATLSLAAGKANPAVEEENVRKKMLKYGEYDYLAETLDKQLYGTSKGDMIPYVGVAPFAALYNRSRFWIADKDLVTAAAARSLNTQDFIDGGATFERTNLLNFANVGTEELSVLVLKANVSGFDVTAENWYGSAENVPSWMRPYDYISDYFVKVVCVKGNWTNYSVLSTDPIWKSYFDKNGIIADKLTSFLGADGVSAVGVWTGCIIPDFVDKQGSNQYIERRVNLQTEKTGLIMSINKDALNVIRYDYTGIDDDNKGAWGLDFDGDFETTTGEGAAKYVVDMCGHEAFMESKDGGIIYEPVELTVAIAGAEQTKYVAKDASVARKAVKTDLALLKGDGDSIMVFDDKETTVCSNVSTGIFVDKDALVNTEDAVEESRLATLISHKYAIINAAGNIFNRTDAQVTVGLPDENGSAQVDFAFGEAHGKANLIVDSSNGKFVAVELTDIEVQKDNKQVEPVCGVNFLSYNYVQKENDGVVENIENAYYFTDANLWGDEGCPLSDDNKNMFFIFDASSWKNEMIETGDYVHNITYKNEEGDAEYYKLIPGLAKVIRKEFCALEQKGEGFVIYYKGKEYEIVLPADIAEKYDTPALKNQSGKNCVCLVTANIPVLIEDGVIVRQKAITSSLISKSLRFIPMKGLQITAKHRPGYDENGKLNIEAGIEKIYGVLRDGGIVRGLTNRLMVSYRHLIDSMGYGLDEEMGGKKYLSIVAKKRGMTTALLNIPSEKQFATSSDPYFCETYIPGAQVRPSFDTKFIPTGGNTEMGSTRIFSLPSEDNGSQFTACFWPYLIYSENGREIPVPPAADVANTFYRKFVGIADAYAITANGDGKIQNPRVVGVEFDADDIDRSYLEPFGINTIIKDGTDIMIYGNQTAYQDEKSDLNKLHVRENLNTAEIACDSIVKKFNFKYNTPAVRASVTQQLSSPLSVMENSGALSGYEIICDESNNTKEMESEGAGIVEVGLYFNHGMERIFQIFELKRLS